MTPSQLNRYLERIGLDPAGLSPEELLRQVHARQAMSIPFENFDVYYGLGVSLEPERLFDKLVTRQRGGYCFELNALLADALRALGFRVKRVTARLGGSGRGFGGYTHCAAIVDAGERRYIADVGYGGGGFVEPLLLEPGLTQSVLGGVYRVRTDERLGYVVDWTRDGELTPYMAIQDIEAFDKDFEIGSFYTSSNPDSGFRKRIMCTLPTPTGRVSLSDGVLKLRDGDVSIDRTVEKHELFPVVAQYFNIRIAERPE